MIKRTIIFFTTAFLLAVSSVSFAQSITIEAEDYQQLYQGGGVSYGLYKAHVWSMSETNQDKFFELLYKDIKMKYVQYYAKKNPADDPNEFDKVATFFNKASVHNDNLDLIFVTGTFPDDLTVTRTVNGSEKDVLDIDSSDIYDRVAEWMLAMINAMNDRGTPIDYFSMANEPDYQKSWRWGYEDSKQGLGLMIESVIPKLEDLLEDNVKNPNNLTLPEIIAPSGIGPGGSRNFINHWIDNIPKAWDVIDVVGTHQYVSGDNKVAFETIQSKLDGRGFIQTEQHTNKGDGLGSLPISDPHRGILSLTSMFSTAVNSGVESWMYFVPNYPNTYHDGGLMQTSWGGSPKPYKTYYAYKQLNSIQSDSSSVVDHSIESDAKLRVVTFRKQDEDKVVMHIANADGESERLTIDVPKTGSGNYGIKAMKVHLTDEDSNIELVKDVSYESSLAKAVVIVPRYTLISVELTLDPDGSTVELLDHTITFNAIGTQDVGNTVELVANSSAGLDVTFDVISGPGEITDNTLNVTGVGTILVRASSPGNDDYYDAEEIFQSIEVNPEGTNVALNKTVTVSSIYNEDTNYTGDKAVDGDKTGNSSRWLTEKGGDYPHWIEIDFGASYEINSLAFYIGYNDYNKPVEDFRFERWNGSEWVTIFEETDNVNPEYKKSFDPVETDKVRLYMTDGNNPVRMFEIEVYGVDVATSFNERFLLNNFKVFPNPAQNQLHVSLNDFKLVAVYSLSGVKILSSEKKTIDVSGLKKGMYIVTATSKTGETFQQKVTKY